MDIPAVTPITALGQPLLMRPRWVPSLPTGSLSLQPWAGGRGRAVVMFGVGVAGHTGCVRVVPACLHTCVCTVGVCVTPHAWRVCICVEQRCWQVAVAAGGHRVSWRVAWAGAPTPAQTTLEEASAVVLGLKVKDSDQVPNQAWPLCPTPAPPCCTTPPALPCAGAHPAQQPHPLADLGFLDGSSPSSAP